MLLTQFIALLCIQAQLLECFFHLLIAFIILTARLYHLLGLTGVIKLLLPLLKTLLRSFQCVLAFAVMTL